jgi:hypothetical protein
MREEVARPVFDLRFLRPLQRVAAQPRFYFRFIFMCLAGAGVLLSLRVKPEIKAIPSLISNTIIFVVLLGCISSRRYNLNLVAVKHVAVHVHIGRRLPFHDF